MHFWPSGEVDMASPVVACLCNISDSKNEGGCLRLMSREDAISLCCVATDAKMLHMTDTSTDNSGLSCWWICQIYALIHSEFNFPDGKWKLFVFLFLQCIIPENSLAWDQCVWHAIIACLHRAFRRSMGVCLLTHARCGARANYMNGGPLLCALRGGSLALCLAQRDAEMDDKMCVWNPSHSC